MKLSSVSKGIILNIYTQAWLVLPDGHPERFIHFIHPVPRYCSNSTIHWCIICFPVFLASTHAFVLDDSLLIVYFWYAICVSNILLEWRIFLAWREQTFWSCFIEMDITFKVGEAFCKIEGVLEKWVNHPRTVLKNIRNILWDFSGLYIRGVVWFLIRHRSFFYVV